MEVHNISLDSSEVDTSGDEMDDENDTRIEYLRDKKNPLYEEFKPWGRPDKTPWLSRNEKTLKFYLQDCDSWACEEFNPVLWYYEDLKLNGRCIKPVIRLHGTDPDGGTVTCFVHGFLQYFYAVPSNDFCHDDIKAFLDCINLAVLHEMERDLECAHLLQYFDKERPPIVMVQLLEDSPELNIFGYHRPSGDQSRRPILKIECWLSKIVWLAAKVLKNGMVTYPFDVDPCTYDLYEDTLNPNIRFLSSLNISCCKWIEIDLEKSEWLDRDTKEPGKCAVLERQTFSQTEIDVDYRCIKEAEPPRKKSMPKLRVLSFDIEVMTRPPDYIFPRGGNDRVLQIGNVLTVFDPQNPTHQAEPLKVVFTLDSCDPIPDTKVFSFINEVEMLEAWRLFVVITDPDVLTGYNINKFDIPFLIDRARVINAQKLPYFGRIIKSQVSYRTIMNENKRITRFSDTKTSVSGRIVFDMLPIIRQMYPNHQSYKLGDVSKRLLNNEEKGDVHFKDIFRLQNMSPSTRNELARYCLQDAWLVSQLIFKDPLTNQKAQENFISYFCEKSTSSGSPLRYLVSKSIEYEKYFKTVRKQKNPDLVFPPFTPYVSRRKASTDSQQRFKRVRRALFANDEEGAD